MFTGLVQDVGTVSRLERGPVTDVWISTHFDPQDFKPGESIACDGVCMTVVEHQGPTFRVQAAPETLRRTTVGSWAPGTKVNLEKALRAGDRLGGHLVQGHVDAVAKVLSARADGGSWALEVELPASLAPLFVEKGSVTLDGVSLTVNTVGERSFQVQLIPETQERTTLKAKGPGAALNVEADIIGRYVARMMGLRQGLTEEQLRAKGY